MYDRLAPFLLSLAALSASAEDLAPTDRAEQPSPASAAVEPQPPSPAPPAVQPQPPSPAPPAVQPQPPAPAAPPTASGPQKPRIELTLAMSLFNSYARGSLDDWFYELTGTKVDDGSPAFYSLRAMLELDAGALKMAAGLGMVMAADHALWGSSLYYGGRDEIVLDPKIVEIPLSLRLRQNAGMWLFVEPALLMGWVTGTLRGSSIAPVDFTMAPGFGGQAALGVGFDLGKHLGLSATLGVRFLQVPLVFLDDTSSTGYSQIVDSAGREVTVDLSGTYGTVNAYVRF